MIAGKWQLDGGFEGPNNFGFDEYCLWQLTRRPPRFPNPGFEINGKEVDYTMGEYGPDIASDYLCDFMERNKDEEFFAYYPMIPPHYPFQPTPDSEEWDPTESREYPKKEWRDEWFADMVTYTDKVVGKIVDKLEELGLRENTLIIFTGDNGTYAGMETDFNGGTYVGGKGNTKDNGTHVPLIVNWPGNTPEGKVSQSLVDFSDMLPTIADVAGIEVPRRWGVDGISFASEIQEAKPLPVIGFIVGTPATAFATKLRSSCATSASRSTVTEESSTWSTTLMRKTPSRDQTSKAAIKPPWKC